MIWRSLFSFVFKILYSLFCVAMMIFLGSVLDLLIYLMVQNCLTWAQLFFPLSTILLITPLLYLLHLFYLEFFPLNLQIILCFDLFV